MYSVFKSIEEVKEKLRCIEDENGLQYVTASKDGSFAVNGMFCH